MKAVPMDRGEGKLPGQSERRGIPPAPLLRGVLKAGGYLDSG